MSSSTSLLASIEATVRAHDPDGLCRSIELRSRPEPYPDVRLSFAAATSPVGERLASAFREHRAVASVRTVKGAVTLRLHDEALREIGSALARGVPMGMEAGDLCRDRRFMVGFVGPNTCKALHVGHLRNIVLGDGLAAMLTSGGGHIVRESLVGDIGRSVGEAMAGFELFHAGELPERRKPDHFVGDCYQQYVARQSDDDEGESNDPSREDRLPTGDEADALLARWRDGDVAVLDLWKRIRDWVMDGHARTLDRLGIAIDRTDFESTGVAEGMALVKEGLASGVLQIGDGGRIVYPTGNADYPMLVLTRDDGFPTEHARLLGAYHRILGACHPDGQYVELAGDEWRPSALPLGKLLASLRPGSQNANHVYLFHAMLTIEGQKASSRSGAPLLVDELLDRLVDAPQVADLAGLSDGAISPALIADAVTRGFFVCFPPSQRQRFSWESFMKPESNPGWSIARALCIVEAGNAEPVALDLDNADQRLLVMQSQSYLRLVAKALRDLQLTGVTRFLRALVDVQLALPSSPERNAMFRTVLRTILRGLGFQAARAAAR